MFLTLVQNLQTNTVFVYEWIMIGWLLRIMLGMFCLLTAGSFALAKDTLPLSFILFGGGIAIIIKSFVYLSRQKCPECGRSFARDKEEVVRHPVRFWHIERRITTYRPCKECRHRMDVKKKTVPRYWFESHK